MEDYRLGAMETRFAELIWQHAPVASGELVKLCQAAFGWKKSTTYTMLRRLCERGLFQNEGGTVSALMTPEAVSAAQSAAFVDETFGGSLPKFVAAFASRKKLSDKEIAALQALIDENRGE